MTALSTAAMAQTAPTATTNNSANNSDSTVVVVTGIRGSLRSSMQIKRNSQGVVDSISSEEMGKFPDTNLAESLQRITGVSIDRSNGEGSFVTVRGFGPEFNLVTLNGRQMPTSTLGDGGSAPSSRSFDFANLASEGVAGVDVYKSGRATVDSGGIGSVINIRTPRPFDHPGLRGSIGVKAVDDTSQFDSKELTPEISGIFSDTFDGNKFGVLVTGSYQKRKSSSSDFSAGWRDGYLGNENNWGSLAQPGDPRYANITNPPCATCVYQVQQNGAYDINYLERERINGQLVLQYRPIESLTATLDYTYSKNKVKDTSYSGGVWFNFNNVSSAWTNGPVAGPIWYSEHFGQNERKDLAYSGSQTANQSENKSLGLNLKWLATDRLNFVLDAHHSTAESKPDSPYGSNMSVGSAIFGVKDQTINYSTYLPVMSYTMYPGIGSQDISLETPTGQAFRNAYFKDQIDQVQLRGHYDVNWNIVDSVDFGVSDVDNKVRSAFGYIQHDTWGGAAPPSEIPADVYHLISLPDKFDGLAGANSPNMPTNIIGFDLPRMVSILDQNQKICGGNMHCLAPYTTDRRINEKTVAPYVQVNGKFDLFSNPAHLVVGVRYERTNINSSALVPVPNPTTAWVSANEFDLDFSGGKSSFTTLKGHYDHVLPNIDFDFRPMSDVVLRASASTTITRPDYGSMQGGQTLDQLFRIGGGTGSQGNPNLLPYKSNNIDLSAEWYYSKDSYVSLGYFHKDVANFISTTTVSESAFGLTNPGDGPRYQAAIAALGPQAATVDIRQYIFTHYPSTTVQTGVDSTGYITGQILSTPQDNPLIFKVTEPTNSSQTAALYGWEFNIQHNFWDTGFGAIVNYTKVNGDAVYDNTKPHTVTQFALTGLSDSANAVVFYDKDGIQARLAYNWRAKFLNGTGPNPSYTDAYGQLDGNASWEFKKNLTVFIEGINLTNSSRKVHQRSENNVSFVSPGWARYDVGVRYAF